MKACALVPLIEHNEVQIFTSKLALEVQWSVLQCIGINDVETRLFTGLLLLIFFVLFILSFATSFIPSLLLAVWLLSILNQLVAMVYVVNLHVF